MAKKKQKGSTEQPALERGDRVKIDTWAEFVVEYANGYTRLEHVRPGQVYHVRTDGEPFNGPSRILRNDIAGLLLEGGQAHKLE